MRRPRFISFALILIVTTLLAPAIFSGKSWAEAPKNGTPCKKLGTSWIYSAYTYTCIKSGKKLVWGKGVLSIRLSGNNISNLPTLEGTAIEKSVQQIILGVTLNPSLPSIPINYLIEDGPNGVYPSVQERSAAYAIDFYRSAGFQITMHSFNIILWRNSNFMNALLAKYGCDILPGDLTGGGYKGFCESDKIGIIIDPILGFGEPFSPDARNSDLGSFSPSEKAIYNWEALLPHEIYHSMQSDWQDGTGKKSFVTGKTPVWFKEGVPQLLAFMSVAKMDNRQISYVVNTYIGDRGNCNTGIRNLQSGCEYTEGIIALEYLVAKFGGLETIRQIQNLEQTRTFSEAFQLATKISLEHFYSDLDQYLSEQGWIK